MEPERLVQIQGQVVALLRATENEAKRFVILLKKVTNANIEHTQEEELWIIVNTGPLSDHEKIVRGVRELEHRFSVVHVYE